MLEPVLTKSVSSKVNYPGFPEHFFDRTLINSYISKVQPPN